MVIQQAARNLGLTEEEIIPISAKNGHKFTPGCGAIALSEPRLVVALGQALPEYRWQLAWNTIGNAASISAVIGLTPLPLIDFIPLAITQSVMVVGIARIYQYKITLSQARELVSTFGLGFWAGPSSINSVNLVVYRAGCLPLQLLLRLLWPWVMLPRSGLKKANGFPRMQSRG